MLTPEYNETLKRLATTLYEPFRSPQEQLDFDPDVPVEVADSVVEVGRTALNRWDDQGTMDYE